MRAFSRVPVARALPASTTLTSRALYTTYRASVPALAPLESRRGRVENAGINDPALNPLKVLGRTTRHDTHRTHR